MECSLKIKELEHNITKFLKDSKDAAHKVRASEIRLGHQGKS